MREASRLLSEEYLIAVYAMSVDFGFVIFDFEYHKKRKTSIVWRLRLYQQWSRLSNRRGAKPINCKTKRVINGTSVMLYRHINPIKPNTTQRSEQKQTGLANSILIEFPRRKKPWRASLAAWASSMCLKKMKA